MTIKVLRKPTGIPFGHVSVVRGVTDAGASQVTAFVVTHKGTSKQHRRAPAALDGGGPRPCDQAHDRGRRRRRSQRRRRASQEGEDAMTPKQAEATLGRYFCRRCADRNMGVAAEERFSMGVYAGMLCDPCWDTDGRNHDRPFDPGDAGEALEAEDY